ncbi:MAG: TonB family protein [Hydrogenophilaceae bacterium]
MIAHLWRLPLTRMLMLSLGLHMAVIMIVQPRPFLPAAEVVVISARLLDKAVEPAPEAAPVSQPEPPESPPVPASETIPEPVAEARPAPAEPPEAKPAPQPVAEPAPSAIARPQPTPSPGLPSLPVMIDSNWYEARQLDSQPRAVARIEPPYPPMAQRRGIEGTVKLKLRIDEFGVVREVEVEEGDPPGLFDESALSAFRQGRFLPARKDGRPVRALIYIRVRYELND